MTSIKICGLTTAEDALGALSAGADYLGLIFAPQSPRCLNIDQAKTLVQAVRDAAIRPALDHKIVSQPDLKNGQLQGLPLQPSIKTPVKIVGVFQDQTLSEIESIVKSVGLDRIQLHGQEPLSLCQAFSVPVIKTVLMDPLLWEQAEGINLFLENLALYTQVDSSIQTILLDLPKQKRHSTSMADLRCPPSVYEAMLNILNGKPFWIAGGLNPSNVAQAISQWQPHGVDVASGVEHSPGKKDPKKMQLFCERVIQH